MVGPAPIEQWFAEHSEPDLNATVNLPDRENADTIPDGQRNNTLTRIAGQLRRIGLHTDEIEPTLNVITRRRCPELPEAEIATIARSIGSKPTEAIGFAPTGKSASTESMWNRIVEAGVLRDWCSTDAIALAVGAVSLAGNVSGASRRAIQNALRDRDIDVSSEKRRGRVTTLYRLAQGPL